MGYVFSAFYLAYALFEIPTGWWGDRVGTRQGPDADRLLVVGVHRADGLRVQLLVAAGDPVSVRRRRGRARGRTSRARSRAGFPRQRARHGAGHLLHGRAPRGRADAAAGHGAARATSAGGSLFALFGSIGFVWARGLVSMVSRFAGRTSRGRRRPSAPDRERARRRHRPCARSDAVEAAALEPDGRLPVPDVLHAGVRRHLLRHVAADLSRVARPDRDDGRHSRRVAADAQRPPRISWAASPPIARCAGLACGSDASRSAAARWPPPVVFTITGAFVASPVAAAVLIALGGASSNFLLGAAWGTCVDIGGRRSGAVSAAMNTSGQVGAILSPILVARSCGTFRTGARRSI